MYINTHRNFFNIYQKNYIYTKQTRISRENREYNTMNIFHICNLLYMCVYARDNKRKTNKRI